MNDGYARAALRLAELSADDRDWLLAQLPVEARERLTPLVERVLVHTEGLLEPQPLVLPVPPPPNEEEVVLHASAWQVVEALRDEPEWLAALILARRAWPWSRDYVDRLEPDRIERLRALTQKVDAAAPPRVFDAAVTALAHKLARMAPGLTDRTAFEGVLARLMGLTRSTAERGSRPWRT